jgi:hypothetical protein
MPIYNRQTVEVFASLAGAVQSFTTNLGLDFDPTAVIVRQVLYNNVNTNDVVAVIAPWTNAKNGIIATFLPRNDFVSNSGSQFKIQNPGALSNGDTTFQVRRLTDVISANLATGTLSLTLEFIREVYPEPTATVSQMAQLIQTLTDMSRPTDVYPFDNIDETKSQPARVETPEPTGKIAELQALEETQAQEGGQDDKKEEVKTIDTTIKTKPRPI